MKDLTIEDLRRVLQHAGLELASEELEQLKALYDRFAPRLQVLRDAPLEDEEIAGSFSPEWPGSSEEA